MFAAYLHKYFWPTVLGVYLLAIMLLIVVVP